MIIDNDGNVKIGDFSLAICLQDQPPSSVVGKMPYLAPELLIQMVIQQQTGQKALPPSAYDERIDVW